MLNSEQRKSQPFHRGESSPGADWLSHALTRAEPLIGPSRLATETGRTEVAALTSARVSLAARGVGDGVHHFVHAPSRLFQ